MNFVIALNDQLQLLRQGVNHGNAYAVQTTGNFIRVIIEFAARVQNGHDHFRRRHALFRVNTGRNTATIIPTETELSLWIVTTMSLQ